VFPQAVAEHMIAVKPQAQLVEIAGAGHAPALMAADQIATVRGFLASSAPLQVRQPEGRRNRSNLIEGLTMPA
jgi:hypothetical protein